MRLPQRLPAAARDAVLRHWPSCRLVRVGRAWAVVGRAAAVPIALETAGAGTDTTDKRCFCQFCQQPTGPFLGESGLPIGWYSVLVTGYDWADGPTEPRLWWTPGAFGLRRRKDAVAAAVAVATEVQP
jgi:hypothetical protein